MEILRPSSYHQNMITNCAVMGGGDNHSTAAPASWTVTENKMFEDALAVYDGETPDRWERVAALIPGKTVGDVVRQYRALEDDVSSIEAGLVPLPGYKCNFPSDPFRVLDWGGRRSRPSEHERKKGIPWTEKEHKLFLLGLKKHGKGDWRSISRNFVITRTPTQVASHAQKYFNRQVSVGKDKRRASIHDITTANLNENQTYSYPENQKMPLYDHPSMLSHNTYSNSVPRIQWRNHSRNEIDRNLFMSPYYGVNSNESFQYVGGENMGFQMNPACVYPHG